MVVVGKIYAKKVDCGNEKYQKSELVIETDEQYKQYILIEFGGNKSDLVDPYSVGQEVEVSINLKGRIWTNPEGVDKYFNTIQGWKITKLKDATNIEVVAETDLPF